MAKNMTSITQVHMYIKEHNKVNDVVTLKSISNKLKWLTKSSISAALWKLCSEDILVHVDTVYNKNIYMINDGYMQDRGFEDREAPEPGAPRFRKSKR